VRWNPFVVITFDKTHPRFLVTSVWGDQSFSNRGVDTKASKSISVYFHSYCEFFVLMNELSKLVYEPLECNVTEQTRRQPVRGLRPSSWEVVQEHFQCTRIRPMITNLMYCFFSNGFLNLSLDGPCLPWRRVSCVNRGKKTSMSKVRKILSHRIWLKVGKVFWNFELLFRYDFPFLWKKSVAPSSCRDQ